MVTSHSSAEMGRLSQSRRDASAVRRMSSGADSGSFSGLAPPKSLGGRGKPRSGRVMRLPVKTPMTESTMAVIPSENSDCVFQSVLGVTL